MDKINENIFTIGFNTKIPEHKKVMDILNSKGRTKAQYIVDAILSFEKGQPTVDLLEIRSCFESILDERGVYGNSRNSNLIGVESVVEDKRGESVTKEDASEILDALDFFRN